MKRQFTIPVMCAVLFHAALLLGSRKESEATTNRPDESKTGPQLAPIPVVSDPPVIELVADDSDIKSKLGDTDESAPVTPEPFSKPIADAVSMEKVPVTINSKISLEKIPVGVVGVPNGSPEGLSLTPNIFAATKLDNTPRSTAQVAPNYPAEARMRGYGGEVVVGFVVNESGRVSSSYVVSTTDPLFNDAALRAVEKWRFEPGRHLGRAVSFRMTVPIVFRLN